MCVCVRACVCVCVIKSACVGGWVSVTEEELVSRVTSGFSSLELVSVLSREVTGVIGSFCRQHISHSGSLGLERGQRCGRCGDN